MGQTHVVSALVKKRSQLAGDLAVLEKQRRDLLRRMSFVDQALREFGYSGDVRAIPARKSVCRRFERHELRRAIQKALASAITGLTDMELAKAIVQAKGWLVTDLDLVRRVANSVNGWRRSAAKRGSVSV